MTTYLIAGATLADGGTADLVLEGGVVAEVGARLSRAGATRIDAAGLLALAGLVDLHTHLREPGGEGSETILSGSRAAAAGGYTAVSAMANTDPVADTAAVVEQVQALGDAAGYVTVRPIGAVTRGLGGEQLADIGGMARSRARVRMFSDDGSCVADPLLMRRALEYIRGFGGVLAQHAQEPRLTVGALLNEGPASADLGLAGWPAVAEEAIVARDVLLAQHTGARLHICHLSTAGSVELVRWAKSRGIAVTAEVTPHHLLLTDRLAGGYDARFKVNPPLRSDADVQAVRAGLADGTIDVVATDHAPHPQDSKTCEWSAASNGMVGLESALSVVHEAMVETGLLDWAGVSRVMSEAPARIGGIRGHGVRPAAGSPPELLLYDPSARHEFAAGDLHGRSRNSPYLGRSLPGRVVAVFHDGRPTVLDGAPLPAETVAGRG